MVENMPTYSKERDIYLELISTEQRRIRRENTNPRFLSIVWSFGSFFFLFFDCISFTHTNGAIRKLDNAR